MQDTSLGYIVRCRPHNGRASNGGLGFCKDVGLSWLGGSDHWPPRHVLSKEMLSAVERNHYGKPTISTVSCNDKSYVQH